LSFFLDETTYSTQADIVIPFLTAVSNIPNPDNARRDAYVYNIATGSQYISGNIGFGDLVNQYTNQGINSTNATTVSLDNAFIYYTGHGPGPDSVTKAPTIIVVTSSYITDLNETGDIVYHFRRNRIAYVVSVTLSAGAAAQLSHIQFDLSIDLANGTQTSAQDAVNSIVNMACSINSNN
ncbi:hypothetical protein FO519_009305, partial [Halicephalobus sp. NKZ332]